jgi:hypothetical protein
MVCLHSDILLATKEEAVIVYHGSNHVVDHPQFGLGKRTNDYGRGFYATESLELAKEWACARNTDGFANRYTLVLDGLSVLDLNGPEYSILNWLAVLARYRSYWQKGSIAEKAKNYLQENFFVDPTPYDIIIGYRADDSYFSFAQDFVSNAISLRKLETAMRLGKLGEQVVIKSQRAFAQISFEDAELADAKIYYERKVSRDRQARRDYRSSKETVDGIDEIYMLDIMREEIRGGDSRLR